MESGLWDYKVHWVTLLLESLLEIGPVQIQKTAGCAAVPTLLQIAGNTSYAI